MKDVMGIIYAAETDVELKDLTRNRSLAAVPFGGRYRIVDFLLSNMVNSGIRNIGIITQNNYSSLMDHIGSGKEWDLNRKVNGLFILPPYINNENIGWYKGSVEALHSIMGYLRKSAQNYVLISGSRMVCNMLYDDAFKYHLEKNADITIIYKEETLPGVDFSRYNIVQTNKDGRVFDMEINPASPKSKKISMKMYIIEKNLLRYLVDESIARGNSDLVKDIIIKKLDTLKIYGYEYKGYLARIDSIPAYYHFNMDILNTRVRRELFYQNGPIYTKVKDEVPAKYSNDAVVKNCIVADGCVIEGMVENSILFRGVKIYKGAKVNNCIIMQNSEIEENAVLEHVILDKEVLIKRGKKLMGQESYPVVIGKRAVI